MPPGLEEIGPQRTWRNDIRPSPCAAEMAIPASQLNTTVLWYSTWWHTDIPGDRLCKAEPWCICPRSLLNPHQVGCQKLATSVSRCQEMATHSFTVSGVSPRFLARQ